jgi:GR25 family glycosyltransferase involved in LPS biosynthesis
VDYRALPAFCINLDARPDRWAQVSAEFQRVDWPLARWPAVCVAPTPAAACLASHQALWRHCINAGYAVMAVFEDDAVLAPRFKDIYANAAAQLPADWEIWHLHSAHARTHRVSPAIVAYRGNGWGSHGYLIRPGACEKLLRLTSAQPVDVQLTGAYLELGGQPYGMTEQSTLCLQRGADTDIPVNSQVDYWRRLRVRLFGQPSAEICSKNTRTV